MGLLDCFFVHGGSPIFWLLDLLFFVGVSVKYFGVNFHDTK